MGVNDETIIDNGYR